MEKLHQCTPAELEQVMKLYGATVYRLAHARVHSAADADDIYQEVFLRYFRKRPIFESEEHRKAWLLRVTVNTSVSHMTSAWMRHTVPLDSEILFPEPTLRELDEALGQLRPRDRMLLHLFYYEELSIREMGQLLHSKESTVRTQLTRARARLKKYFKGEERDERTVSANESAY